MLTSQELKTIEGALVAAMRYVEQCEPPAPPQGPTDDAAMWGRYEPPPPVIMGQLNEARELIRKATA